MKQLYWRPHKVSRVELLAVTLLAVGGLLGVEHFQVVQEQPFYAEKLAAARLARRAHEALRAEALARGYEPDPETDPRGTGLVGELITPTTSNSGHLGAKQQTLNPNFAAVVVHYLRRAGVKPGDVVAVGASGSFPGFNVAVYAALESLGARPLVITSVSGSQWGANRPDFTWLDMEAALRKRGVINIKAIAGSRGGIEDRAQGVSDEGQSLLDAAMARNGVRNLAPPTYQASVERRMEAFDEAAGGDAVKAYINIGGGTASVGTRVGKRLFKPGLNRFAPKNVAKIDSVMGRYALAGVPVIHLVRVAQFVERYGFDPAPTAQHPVGEGRIYKRAVYNRWLAGSVILLVLGALIAVVRTDWGHRLLRSGGAREDRKPPEQMV